MDPNITPVPPVSPVMPPPSAPAPTPAPVQNTSSPSPHRSILKPLLILLVAVALAAAGWFAYTNWASAPGRNTGSVNEDKLFHAAAGELIPGFPEELILRADAEVTESGSFTDTFKNGDLFTAVFASYTTAEDANDMHKLYTDLIAEKGYYLISSNRAEDDTRSVVFGRKRDHASVVITPQGRDSLVKVVVTKQN